MLPILNLGPLHLSTYWTLYILAAVLGGSLIFWRFVHAGLPAQQVAGAAQWVILGVLLGSFVLAGLLHSLRAYLLTGRLYWPGRSSFVGTLIGGWAGACFAFRRYGIPVRRGFDLAILYVPLAQAIGRLGCLAQGCCYGAPTSSWLGLYLPDSSGYWTLRYPAPLMAAIIDLGIFFLLLGWERYGRRVHQRVSWPYPGALFLLYMALYALKRLVLEFLRADHPAMWGIFTMEQGLALVALLAAGYTSWRWAKDTPVESEADSSTGSGRDL